MKRGEIEHGKDDRGRLWVAIPTAVEEAAEVAQNAIGPSTLQLIQELTAERDRWVAEAAAKQATIDLLFQQAENYQVLLYEAQSQLKRLSAPREKPPLLMERIDQREVDASGPEPPSLPANTMSASDIAAPEPVHVHSRRRSWWRW